MSRYDRYVLSQYLLFFGFFALILVAVFWLNRAVVLFDRLIGDGQSALVFLEFTALTLPNLVRMVLPVAAFAASIWVTNRLHSESELTVLRSTGSSPWQMARPALAFGLITALMMSALTHVLLPASISQLEVREREVSRNVTARLLTEGNFLHPTKGVTFYIRQIDPDGTLRDVFLSDRRDPDRAVTYTGARAFLVRDEDRAHLILVEGMAQRLDAKTRRLSTTVFSDFSYDISELTKKTENPIRNIRAIPSLELLTARAEVTATDGYSAGTQSEELHLRFAQALICVVVALIGFSTLMLGTFSRFGVWRQALLAFLLLILVEGMRGVVSDPVIKNPDLWPLIYLPALIGLFFALGFLYLASHPGLMHWQRPSKPGDHPA
ncbi:LPS export ABC transporter permease LptF [Phaeobacter sp. QD34_3]|uniref:LPS export ABC transporter permease LptF n=1 Tax=unclassified Phaeobacter TaxID=2621772 RepID=UPI00237FB499|nr:MULTISPECIES: LPS export ABC transporter permease LptF [unclassified Phaeobacter]MDE4134139.1 LPS export ABC transporter permease LptF [Phaeobacter sp. QD34_3]MDE4137938.1 LPS export ABC transporter permease LptF [Phaeobacter sp. QD34_24]MDE4175109.1 LPS export ABC transporter permease LptF [Phaeobacter sp. PT47_59]